MPIFVTKWSENTQHEFCVTACILEAFLPPKPELRVNATEIYPRIYRRTRRSPNRTGAAPSRSGLTAPGRLRLRRRVASALALRFLGLQEGDVVLRCKGVFLKGRLKALSWTATRGVARAAGVVWLVVKKHLEWRLPLGQQ